MNEIIENWIKSAKYDLDTAEKLFASERFIYTVFMCHLALEKILKAKIQEKTDKAPPKIHDLTHLLKISELTISEKDEIFISEIANLSVNIRYPEDFTSLFNNFHKSRVEKVLTRTLEVFQWILKSIEL